uniref:L27 domain-containing protein n=1 Tax=Piliocolobus tephrosceles TaxID=591936 RepID=A0A8C9LMP2_9PRIM
PGSEIISLPQEGLHLPTAQDFLLRCPISGPVCCPSCPHSHGWDIHEKLRYYERQSPTPVLHSAVALTEDVMELQAASVHSDERELLQLLSTPHLRAVLMVHDTVAQKNFDPILLPLPDNIDEDFDEESVKIVRLVKNKEPLMRISPLPLFPHL